MKNLKEDKKAKSKSFFLNSEKEFFSKKHINFITNHYRKTKKDIRICLHKGRTDNHHDMTIFLKYLGYRLYNKKIFINLINTFEKVKHII